MEYVSIVEKIKKNCAYLYLLHVIVEQYKQEE